MTERTIEAILSPLEFEALSRRDLRHATCVVFDVLRATSSMVTALANGAEAIHPVSEIYQALELHRQNPSTLLAGERDGLRICGEQTEGIDFHLGNSPREFTPAQVQGKTIVMTTTNGTRALRACAGAQHVLIGSFLNLRPTALWLREREPAHLILVCAGTVDQPALEDMLAAGALCEKIWSCYSHGFVADSAEAVRRLWPLLGTNLPEAMRSARNGRRLLAHPELRDDVWFCVQRETADFVVEMTPEGVVRRAR